MAKCSSNCKGQCTRWKHSLLHSWGEEHPNGRVVGHSSDWLTSWALRGRGDCMWSTIPEGQMCHHSTCLNRSVRELCVPCTLSLIFLPDCNQLGTVFRILDSEKDKAICMIKSQGPCNV